MKTLVVGTGVIGTIYGWALAEGGTSVTHLVRPAKLDQDALRIDVLDERKGHLEENVTTYRPMQVGAIAPTDGYELVIVPVNAFQLEGVLAELAPMSGDALFVIMTANWEGTAAIDRILPRERYLLAYPDGGGTIRDGLYWSNLGSELHIGRLEGQPAEGLERVREVFARADINLDVQAEILHWLWVHNASAIGFAAGFAKYLEVEPFIRDRALLATCFRATRELLAVCERRGAVVKRYPDVSMVKWPMLLTIPLMRRMWRTNKSMQRYTAHAASPGSLRETAETYHAMLRTAEELGVSVPSLRSLGGDLDQRVSRLNPSLTPA